jgi:hypothetical protein
MAQLTIYLPRDVEERARRAAKAKKQSVSRWIADQLNSQLSGTWPQEVLDAAGAFPDFPTVEELRKGYGRNARRESFD